MATVVTTELELPDGALVQFAITMASFVNEDGTQGWRFDIDGGASGIQVVGLLELVKAAVARHAADV